MLLSEWVSEGKVVLKKIATHLKQASTDLNISPWLVVLQPEPGQLGQPSAHRHHLLAGQVGLRGGAERVGRVERRAGHVQAALARLKTGQVILGGEKNKFTIIGKKICYSLRFIECVCDCVSYLEIVFPT